MLRVFIVNESLKISSGCLLVIEGVSESRVSGFEAVVIQFSSGVSS